MVTRGSVRGLCGLETDCFSPWDLVSGECLLHEHSASCILFRLFCTCFFNTFPKSPFRNGAVMDVTCSLGFQSKPFNTATVWV